jgi:hypothetical protein
MQFCWDFPDFVMHKDDCPRYVKGAGPCRPVPAPDPSYREQWTEEQRLIVEAYVSFKTEVVRRALGMPATPEWELEPVKAENPTIFPEEEARA